MIENRFFYGSHKRAMNLRVEKSLFRSLLTKVWCVINYSSALNCATRSLIRLAMRAFLSKNKDKKHFFFLFIIERSKNNLLSLDAGNFCNGIKNTETCDLCPEYSTFRSFIWDLTGKLNNHNLLDGFICLLMKGKRVLQGLWKESRFELKNLSHIFSYTNLRSLRCSSTF